MKDTDNTMNTTNAARNNTDAIRELLSADIRRIRSYENALETIRKRLDFWTDDDGVDPMQLRRQFDQQFSATEQARQSFAARTEMLQHLDLGGTTADELIASAVGAASRGLGGAPDVSSPGARPTTSAARTIDQDVRDFLNTHNATNHR